MKVRNNQQNPYMLCGVLIPPNGVAEVNDRDFEDMMQVEAFKKVMDSKLVEKVEVQVVSPGFENTPNASKNASLNTQGSNTSKSVK